MKYGTSPTPSMAAEEGGEGGREEGGEGGREEGGEEGEDHTTHLTHTLPLTRLLYLPSILSISTFIDKSKSDGTTEGHRELRHYKSISCNFHSLNPPSTP